VGATHVATAPSRAPVGTTRVETRGETASSRAPVGTTHVATAPSRAPVGAPHVEAEDVRALALTALIGLGWKAGIARSAVDAACARAGGHPAIEVVIREALRRCPVPTG